MVFLTLFTMSSYAIDKYDFFVDKGLPVQIEKSQNKNFMKVVATIKIQQLLKWLVDLYLLSRGQKHKLELSKI